MNKIEVRTEEGRVVVQNNKYQQPVNCFDRSVLPDIGSEYTYLQWSDVAWFEKFYVDLNNHMQSFTQEQNSILENICSNWEQPLGQEGNYTEEQIKQHELQLAIYEAKAYLDKTDYKMLLHYTPKEGEDMLSIIAKRNELREFIRSNEPMLNQGGV